MRIALAQSPHPAVTTGGRATRRIRHAQSVHIFDQRIIDRMSESNGVGRHFPMKRRVSSGWFGVHPPAGSGAGDDLIPPFAMVEGLRLRRSAKIDIQPIEAGIDGGFHILWMAAHMRQQEGVSLSAHQFIAHRLMAGYLPLA